MLVTPSTSISWFHSAVDCCEKHKTVCELARGSLYAGLLLAGGGAPMPLGAKVACFVAGGVGVVIELIRCMCCAPPIDRELLQMHAIQV